MRFLFCPICQSFNTSLTTHARDTHGSEHSDTMMGPWAHTHTHLNDGPQKTPAVLGQLSYCVDMIVDILGFGRLLMSSSKLQEPQVQVDVCIAKIPQGIPGNTMCAVNGDIGIIFDLRPPLFTCIS